MTAFYIFLFLVLAVLTALSILPEKVERKMNRVLQKPPYTVSKETADLHQNLFVVDLHADPLMWKRDLLKRNDYGQVDIPRMVEGNVAFQVFGIVTKSPRGQNFQKNTADAPDNITTLVLLQAWPPRTWNSLFQRALYQAQKLEGIARRSQGKFILVRNAADLDRLVEAHRQNRQVVGGFAMLEGVHALEGKVKNLDRLYDAGVRVIGLAHFFDNEAGGSAHGAEKGGLTPFGRDVVRKVQEKHMILDLAHSSPQVVDEVLAMTQAPVIVSHTGVRGTCDSIRNLTDEHVRGVAATGGVMGLAMFDTAVGATDLDATARAVRYVADLVGVEYAAIGGDMDGTITAPVDVSGSPLLTEALLRQGFTEKEIAMIMGENALRVMRKILPSGS